MSVQLLPICSVPKLGLRDGLVGAYAKLLLPFYGYWFASGQVPTFPSSTVAQSSALTITGLAKPNTFKKDCCTCNNNA